MPILLKVLIADARAIVPITFGEPASCLSGDEFHFIKSWVTISTVPPPTKLGSHLSKILLGPISTPVPKGAYILWAEKIKKSILHSGFLLFIEKVEWGINCAPSTSSLQPNLWTNLAIS